LDLGELGCPEPAECGPYRFVASRAKGSSYPGSYRRHLASGKESSSVTHNSVRGKAMLATSWSGPVLIALFMDHTRLGGDCAVPTPCPPPWFSPPKPPEQCLKCAQDQGDRFVFKPLQESLRIGHCTENFRRKIDKNKLKMKQIPEINFSRKYFTELTLLCRARIEEVADLCVTPSITTSHMH
jgi:hypothetical protein